MRNKYEFTAPRTWSAEEIERGKKAVKAVIRREKYWPCMNADYAGTFFRGHTSHPIGTTRKVTIHLTRKV